MDRDRHGGQKTEDFQADDLVAGHICVIAYISFILSATSYIIFMEKKKGGNYIIQSISVTWFIRLLI